MILIKHRFLIKLFLPDRSTCFYWCYPHFIQTRSPYWYLKDTPLKRIYISYILNMYMFLLGMQTLEEKKHSIVLILPKVLSKNLTLQQVHVILNWTCNRATLYYVSLMILIKYRFLIKLFLPEIGQLFSIDAIHTSFRSKIPYWYTSREH